MLFLNLLREFFPCSCLRCGTQVLTDGVCPSCWTSIKWAALIRCARCCKQLPYKLEPGTKCIGCEGRKGFIDGMDVVMQYNQEIKGIIMRLKNNSDFRVVQWLSNLMSQNITELHFDYITPIPLHFFRRMWRGYNQAAQLAKVIGQNRGIQYAELLNKTKLTRSQGRFNGVARQKNVEGVFKIVNEVELVGKSILVVDDVCTTGSTLESAAKTLKQGGASRVWAIVAAKT